MNVKDSYSINFFILKVLLLELVSDLMDKFSKQNFYHTVLSYHILITLLLMIVVFAILRLFLFFQLFKISHLNLLLVTKRHTINWQLAHEIYRLCIDLKMAHHSFLNVSLILTLHDKPRSFFLNKRPIHKLVVIVLLDRIVFHLQCFEFIKKLFQGFNLGNLVQMKVQMLQ